MYDIERYGAGYIVADYSGDRGQFGAAFLGKDGGWRSQLIGLTPFATEAEAKKMLAESPQDERRRIMMWRV